jgi:hypothetical protein
MNKILFTKLFVDDEEISGHELGEAVRDLVEADRLVSRNGGQASGWVATTRATNGSSPAGDDGAAWLRTTETVYLP